MYLAIIVLPIMGSIVSGFFGRVVGVSGAQLITCTSVLITTCLAIAAFLEVGLNNVPVSIELFRWVDSESLAVSWAFNFDSLTVTMLIPVLIVSSLVHIYSVGYMSHDPHNQRFFSYLSLFAATLVTAGVYLLMRSSPLIEYSPTVLILCLWIGSITTVFSSLIGLFQQDIKKVIAYSTMSQLGMMVIAVGLSSYNIALFHLVNHALFDFRKYGGLIAFLPLSYTVMLVASLSLVAFPFMTGFYSKDFILESAYGGHHLSSIAVYFIATIGALFTTLYSVKVLYLTFLTSANGPLINYKGAHEGDIAMSLPLIILGFASIFFGYITKDLFIGMGTGFFTDNSLFIHPMHEIMLETEFAVPTLFKLLPLFLTLTASALSLVYSEVLPKSLVNFKLTRFGYNIFGFFNQRFLIEAFYNRYITRFILRLGGQTTKVLDKGSVEALGPYGLERGLLKLSRSLSSLDTGVITTYALYILMGLIFYILIPYITLIDISILLSLIVALLSIIDKTASLDIPSPNLSVKSHLYMQSSFLRPGKGPKGDGMLSALLAWGARIRSLATF
uniref:NADH-ubiquinone oxidoreductase chain 5 n=1 Tax=Usnea ceratina TaxID=142670 RepID=A0A286QHZ5_9LECA|nr:NADH dehydrogenase subunit 5 [Usnea ceratina]